MKINLTNEFENQKNIILKNIKNHISEKYPMLKISFNVDKYKDFTDLCYIENENTDKIITLYFEQDSDELKFDICCIGENDVDLYLISLDELDGIIENNLI